MNTVNEYLIGLLTDRSRARKLMNLIEGLKRGKTMREAAVEASLSPEELDGILDSIGKALSAASSGTTKAPSRDPDRERRTVIAYADGASRGNPGESACAAVLCDESSTEILSRSERLGVATNNVAEYRGVILALRLARELGAAVIVIRLDSELVVNQLNGRYKVKHAGLKPLHDQVHALLSGFARVSIEHIPREKNARADDLANAALDAEG
jgi:ribonuclease HI